MTAQSASTDRPIAFVPNMDNWGGIERILVALSDALHRRGVGITLLCFRCRIQLADYAERPIEVVTLTESENPWVRARTLAGYLGRSHASSRHVPLIFGIKASFYQGILQRSPFHLHFTDPPSLLSGGRSARLRTIRQFGAHLLTKRGVHRASSLLTMTHRNARELLEVYGRNAEVDFLGGVPPAATFRQTSRTRLTVLSVCRIESSKRIDWIVRAVAAFNKRRSTDSRCRLVVIGQGSALDDLRALATSLALGDSVDFMGAASAADLETAFGAASLFAMPAIQGYGLPALEALYRRVPVVLHEDSGVNEALRDEPMAVISRGGPESFTQDLIETLERVERGDMPTEPSSDLPTEEGWALKIARRCGWIPE